ncbi:tyrosine-type recombinase/integrase [Clostridium transplantifaecale]|uniref:tyrosine-type recombinase/integrase n=1 Tax=Clostridium transplantifaecale TaxID=2479838 RepID=UPI001FAA18E1|nr:site-specific integrase [Clostridium transplantifaecale]
MSFYVSKTKRKNGTKYRIIHDRTRNGTRTRKYFNLPPGTTKAKADSICNQMALEAEYGNYVSKDPILFEEYAEEIYFPKYAKGLSPTTLQHYKQIYYAPKGIKEKIGNLYLSEISTEVLQDIVNEYEALGSSPKSIRNIVNLISIIIKRTKIDNYLNRDTPNPCDFLILPKMMSKEGNVYSIEEIKLMMERAQHTKNINMQLILVLCCFAGGLRRSELIGLRWDDIVHGEESYIQIRRAAVYAEGKVMEKETKTKASNRIIPRPSNGVVYNTLLAARNQNSKEKLVEKDFLGDNHGYI